MRVRLLKQKQPHKDRTIYTALRDAGHLASVELPQGVADAVCHQALPLGVGVQPVWHQLDLYLFVAWAVKPKAVNWPTLVEAASSTSSTRGYGRAPSGAVSPHGSVELPRAAKRALRRTGAACFLSDGAVAPMSEFALP
eukprot:scaffold85157_cov69-Phaeocystis_antarctica.AAC.2